jgi:hypothetical protein
MSAFPPKADMTKDHEGAKGYPANHRNSVRFGLLAA